MTKQKPSKACINLALELFLHSSELDQAIQECEKLIQQQKKNQKKGKPE